MLRIIFSLISLEAYSFDGTPLDPALSIAHGMLGTMLFINAVQNQDTSTSNNDSNAYTSDIYEYANIPSISENPDLDKASAVLAANPNFIRDIDKLIAKYSSPEAQKQNISQTETTTNVPQPKVETPVTPKPVVKRQVSRKGTKRVIRAPIKRPSKRKNNI